MTVEEFYRFLEKQNLLKDFFKDAFSQNDPAYTQIIVPSNYEEVLSILLKKGDNPADNCIVWSRTTTPTQYAHADWKFRRKLREKKKSSS